MSWTFTGKGTQSSQLAHSQVTSHNFVNTISQGNLARRGRWHPLETGFRPLWMTPLSAP